MVDKLSKEWKNAKPWICDRITFESKVNSISCENQDEARLAVVYPKEENFTSYFFPEVDHLIRPISDGKIKIFALFQPNAIESCLAHGSHKKMLIYIETYHLKVMGAYFDSRSLANTSTARDMGYLFTHTLVFTIDDFQIKHQNIKLSSSIWFFDVDTCRAAVDQVIEEEMKRRNKLESLRLAIQTEELRLDQIIQPNHLVVDVVNHISPNFSGFKNQSTSEHFGDKSSNSENYYSVTSHCEQQCASAEGFENTDFCMGNYLNSIIIHSNENADRNVNARLLNIEAFSPLQEDSAPIGPDFPSTSTLGASLNDEISSLVVPETPLQHNSLYATPEQIFSTIKRIEKCETFSEKKYWCSICDEPSHVKIKIPNIDIKSNSRIRLRRRRRSHHHPFKISLAEKKTASANCSLCEEAAIERNILFQDSQCDMCSKELNLDENSQCNHNEMEMMDRVLACRPVHENKWNDIKKNWLELVSILYPQFQQKTS